MKQERRAVSWIPPSSLTAETQPLWAATDSITSAVWLTHVPGLDLEHNVVCGVKGKGQGARNINFLSTNGTEYEVYAKVHYLLKDQVKYLCFSTNNETALEF